MISGTHDLTMRAAWNAEGSTKPACDPLPSVAEILKPSIERCRSLLIEAPSNEVEAILETFNRSSVSALQSLDVKVRNSSGSTALLVAMVESLLQKANIISTLSFAEVEFYTSSFDIPIILSNPDMLISLPHLTSLLCEAIRHPSTRYSES